MAAPRLTGRSRSRNGRRAQDLRAEPAREVVHRGRAKLGKRTKLLVRRLKPGDIAVIDHQDIDRVAADDLVELGVRCVLNAASSSSGRYPNPGPTILTDAGVHLVDVPDAALFELLEDGQHLVVREGEIYRDDELVATGTVVDREEAHRAHERARQRIGEALADFAENTIAHMRDERELLAGSIDLPEFTTAFRDRTVLVVVRGVEHQKDLRILRPYVRDVKPVLVAVDGGADALMSDGFTPHMIVGDMDSASDAALRSGAELVVHAYPDGRAPGRERLDRLGLAYKVVPAPATSEDVAMLIAAEKGAQLIVAVGTHFNLVEFLDKARDGMSSTFLTRLRVGEILVDAKGVSRLYRPSAGRGPLIVVTLAALLVLVVVVVTSPTLGQFLDLVWLRLQILLGLK
ncbi:MAG TPA: putative cytokinetic ring protein SteA [Thermoleophilaceae bacterium]|jgi:uncharacterized membrane-anchored protein|nr:putative cytokinetic ring protein SteA [Thermoleophilaceae bacterium]